MGFFPIDRQTLGIPAPDRPQRRGSRNWSSATAAEQQLVAHRRWPGAHVHQVLSLDLGTVEPQPGRTEAAAGPRAAGGDESSRSGSRCGPRWPNVVSASTRRTSRRTATVGVNGRQRRPSATARVVIAAITSCTNTSNPAVMLAAGLLAKKAVEKGTAGQAVRQDQPGPRLARGHRLSGASRA